MSEAVRKPQGDRPPAATTGSPGTSIFRPPAQPPRTHGAARRVQSSQKSADTIPMQWSFESVYGISGTTGGVALPPRATEVSTVGSWFRRRDKVKTRSRAKSVDSPRVARSESEQELQPEPGSAPVNSLPAIPASNAPTPRASRAPSPVRPSQSFRPTTSNRPGSSAGFKNVSFLSQRRPATSSGVPSRPSSPFVLKNGKRHHSTDAPYPRSYERKVLAHDVWELGFARQLAGAPTFHAFDTPPARVLDLGCGTGTWILNTAQDWCQTSFTGLDLVPLAPPPKLCPKNVKFVLANCLAGLPFRDGSFDFVRVCRIARGVPEDKWGPLFEEVKRVLEPGGRLEVIEEDLFWVGGGEELGGEWVGDEERSESSSVRERGVSGRASEATLREPRKLEATLRERDTHIVQGGHVGASKMVPRENDTRNHSGRNSIASLSEPERPHSAPHTNGWPSRSTPLQLRSSLASHPYASSHPPVHTLAPSPSRHPYASSPHLSPHAHTSSPRPPSSHASHTTSSHASHTASSHASLDPSRPPSPPSSITSSSSSHSSSSTSLFHVPLSDPRDHSLLARTYADMHSARFINLAPLAVVHEALVQWFRDVRSHAALQLAFPPPPSAAPSHTHISATQTLTHTTVGLSVPPTSPTSPLSHSRATSTSPTAHPISTISTPSTAPYITLDPFSAPPSTQLTLPHRPRIDLAALNMHLSARVVEVLACAEEMWTFLKEKERSGGERVSREEWEECLARYEMDMQDKIGLGAALRDRLAWNVRPTPRTPERKAFDESVARWERQQRRRAAEDGRNEANGKGEDGRSTGTTGKSGSGKDKRMPLSRRLRVFVAWKGE